MTTCHQICTEEDVRAVIHRVMAASASWLSLTDLGRIYGISAIHCGRTMEHLGWRDRRGRPTPIALDMGAAMSRYSQGRGTLWNRDICGRELQARGYSPMSRSCRCSSGPSFWKRWRRDLHRSMPPLNRWRKTSPANLRRMSTTNLLLVAVASASAINRVAQARRRPSAC